MAIRNFSNLEKAIGKNWMAQTQIKSHLFVLKNYKISKLISTEYPYN